MTHAGPSLPALGSAPDVADSLKQQRADVSWTLTAIRSPDGLGTARDNWSDLNHRIMGGHPLLDPRFVDGLLQHFGESGVQLATAHQAGVVVAMVLLNAKGRGMGVWQSFLPAQAQIGLCLIPPGLDMRGLFRCLPSMANELDLLCNDPRFVDYRELAPTPAVRSLPHALTMSVSLRDTFDDYWAQRPRKLIQNMRRYARRLQTECPQHELRITSSRKEMPGAVARYADLEAMGWKGREGTALRTNAAQGLFYEQVMACFAHQGQALVYELWLGDQLVASRLVLNSAAMVVMLKTTFDEQFERFAPGRILLMRTLEDLFKKAQGKRVEFYTNADADLLAWSTSQRWINHVSFYKRRGMPSLYAILRRSTRRLRQHDTRPADSQMLITRSGATVDTYASVRELPADARALMSRAEQEHVEFGPDWFALLHETVYRAQSQTALIRFHVLRRQGRTLAVLPTVAQDTVIGRQVNALSNFYTAIFAPALAPDVSAEDLLPLTRCLRSGKLRPGTYRFAPMAPDSLAFQKLRGALKLAGLSVHSYFCFGNWYEPVHQTAREYLQSRNGQVRNTIKRCGKKFAAEGGRLEIVQEGESIELALNAYQAVYARSWKIAEPFPKFMPGLVRLCARRGWLRMGVAWLRDTPVAAQIWIVANGRADIYKLAYDEAYKALAPGTLLTAHLMEYAIDVDRVREIDYLIGDDPYKATWMSHRRERHGLVAYDPRTLHGLLGLTRQAVGAAWRRLRPKRTAAKDNAAA